MPSEGQADGASSTTGSGDGTTLVPNHLASLVPSFDPSKDDLVAYSQKVQLLLGMWPDNKWTELATRLILNTSGSAFMKLQLQQATLTRNEKKSIQRIVEVLGGHWGQINLENSTSTLRERFLDVPRRPTKRRTLILREPMLCGRN